MRYSLIVTVLALALGGCAIGGNQYYISITDSGSGSASPIITNTPSKTVDTTLGASVSATAAASQNGSATNSGASTAHGLEAQP